MWFVTHAGPLNLGCSLLISAVGFAIYRFGSPRVFERAEFSRTAFALSLLQWFSYVLIWLIEMLGPPQQVLLAAVDAQTVITWAFCYSMLRAGKAKWSVFLLDAGVVYAFLVLLNLSIRFSIGPQPSESQLQWWIMLSEIASAGALGLMALTMLARYGYIASGFALVALTYLVLQRPTYQMIFVAQNPAEIERGWLVALAVGKLFCAVVFYTVFFCPMRTTEPISLFSWARVKNALAFMPVRLRPLLAFLLGVALKFTTDLAAKWLEHLWHGNGPTVS
jgi:hypothetical protein